MGPRRALIAVFLLLPALGAAAPAFPPLTGRVVDEAGMLGAGAEQALTRQLAAHEQATGNQIVVATLPDLQGYTIEDFGYQLGRHWGIGRKENDNGALLLVAAAERKVRIEVGYGLEGALTDALSSNIIQGVILPQFRRGDFEGGITRGVEAILKAVQGEYVSDESSSSEEGSGSMKPRLVFLVILILFIFAVNMLPGGRGGFWGGYGGGFGRGGGWGRGGGGFRGGGGGFGGGGASGGW